MEETRPLLWIEVDGEPVALCGSTVEQARQQTDWMKRMGPDGRRVALDLVRGEVGSGSVRVSTVFLLSDHNMHGAGAPVLYETMVFDEVTDGEQRYNDRDCERYCTRKQAIAGHARMVAKWKLLLTAAGDARRRLGEDLDEVEEESA